MDTIFHSETIATTTFILRFLVGIIIFGISYQAWNLFRGINSPTSRALAKKMAIIFAVFGVLRFITAFPDIYVNGLFSNIVNDVCLGWFYLVLRKRNQEATNLTPETGQKLSEFLEDIIHELQRDSNKKEEIE